MSQAMTTHDHERTPADLTPTESRLSALAERDRRAAPASLEDRLFLATRAKITEPAGAPAPIPMPAAPSWRAPLRLAAAIAVIVSAGLIATLVFSPGAPSATPVANNTPPTGEVDIDAVRADLDDFLASLDPASNGDDSILIIRSDIESTEDDLDAFWASDALDLNLSEDSL